MARRAGSTPAPSLARKGNLPRIDDHVGDTGMHWTIKTFPFGTQATLECQFGTLAQVIHDNDGDVYTIIIYGQNPRFDADGPRKPLETVLSETQASVVAILRDMIGDANIIEVRSGQLD
jgi:hypothetical protein